MHNVSPSSKDIVNLLAKASEIGRENRRGNQEVIVSSFRCPCHTHLIACIYSDRSTARESSNRRQEGEKSKELEHCVMSIRDTCDARQPAFRSKATNVYGQMQEMKDAGCNMKRTSVPQCPSGRIRE